MAGYIMKNLFSYLKNHIDLILLKSCVFHYEMEFMLEVIERALSELIAVGKQKLSDMERIEQFIESFEQESFERKDYLKKYPELSPATASRDLKKGFEMGLISKSGDKNTTTY